MKRQPRKKYAGIEGQLMRGRWRWRARRNFEGMTHTSQFYDSQEEAARASLDLTPHVDSPSLKEGLEKAIVLAQRRNVSAYTIKEQWEYGSKYLQRWLSGPLDRLDLMKFVTDSLARGRSPNTLLQKDLPLLGWAYRAVGMVDHTLEAKQSLKFIPPRMSWFTPEEVGKIIYRMRHEDFGVRLPARERHADICELIALTGLRSGELARLTVDSIDLGLHIIKVRSKTQTQPRIVEVVPALEALVQRLQAEARNGILIPGGRNTIANMFRHWKLRLQEHRFSARALRHSFGTGLAYSGSTFGEVMDLMGHKHGATTDRYLHCISGQRAAAIQRLVHRVRYTPPEPKQ